MSLAISSLLGGLLKTGIDQWSKNQDFNTLRLLAHERISRELFWNQECLNVRRKEEQRSYWELIRTEAFDELVNMGAPVDELFRDPIHALNEADSPLIDAQLRSRIEKSDRISMLLDRTYNRLWMLRHRTSKELSPGDISYLRKLVKLSLHEVNHYRGVYQK